MPSLNPPQLKEPKSYLYVLLSALLIIFLISGCAVKEEEEGLYSKSITERRFVNICKDEFDLEIMPKIVGNTLWIYIPYEREIFKVVPRECAIGQCGVQCLDGEFSEGKFYFDYQISPLLGPIKCPTINIDFTEEVAEDFRNLLQTIYRIYFNSQLQPKFYCIVLADIVNGVKATNTIYELDFKKVFNNAITPFEYSRRVLRDYQGDEAIIQDKTGEHVNYHDIEFPEFLTEQIVQRIDLYFRGDVDSKCCEAPEEGILKIISYCVRVYEFQRFSNIILKNSLSGSETTVHRSNLKEVDAY